MSESFFATFYVALGAVCNALVLFGIIYLGRFCYKLSFKVNVEDEITNKRNPAMGVALAGFLIGLAIAASSGFTAQGTSINKALMVAGIGVASIILMRFSLLINDKVILRKHDNLFEIVQHRNLGVAFIEAGGNIATGLMINGVMSGKADSLSEKILYGLLYFVIGQGCLIIAAQVYAPTCGLSLDSDLDHNNTAAGLSYGAFLASVGLIIQAAFDGISTDVPAEIATIIVFMGTGLVLLIGGKWLLDKVLVSSKSISSEIHDDENVGAGALSAGGYICIAIIFAASIAPANTVAAFSDMIHDEPQIYLPLDTVSSNGNASATISPLMLR